MKAVLWDLDGTLIDSAEHHFLAWRDTLSLESFELSHERFAATFGRRNDAVLRDFLGPGITLSEIKRISAAKEGRFRELLRETAIAPLPGVRHWLERLHADGWVQAIASSAPRRNLEAMIEVLGIASFFQASVGAEDVEHGKPEPDVFLLAAARLGVPPERSIVVEDAPAGVEAARRAGMRVIGTRTTHNELTADLVVSSLEDLPGDAFERLLGA